ncbi:MAG: ABC transporter ATP-binding protein [Sedimentitalea sp.]
MAISHLLQDFSTSTGDQATLQLMSDDALDDLRLAAFEQGYSAGWDDAISAQTKEHNKATGALAKNLEDLSFTYHEALSQMISATEPVFRCLTDRILPEAMAKTLGHHIVDQLLEIAKTQAGQPATICVPVGHRAMLSDVMEQDFSMPIDVIEDPRLEESQVALRMGTAERQIDTDQLMDSIRNAIDAFYYQINKEAVNE